MLEARTSLTRRMAQGLGSQGLSSISNFALVIVTARASSAEQFGAFAIGYSVGQLLLGVSRSTFGGVLAVTEADRESRRAGLGAALSLAAFAGLALLAVGLVWPHALIGRWLILFGIALPLLVWQDTLRSIAFAVHRPSEAAMNDGIWVAVQVLGWLALASTDNFEPALLFAVWVLGAVVGAAAVGRSVGSPIFRGARRWLLSNRSLTRGFATEGALSLGSPQAAVYALGLVVGLPAAGALRGAQSLYGPVRLLLVGIGAVALPELAERRRCDSQFGGFLIRLSVSLAGVAAAATAAISLLPEWFGRQLLAETWPAASTVMPYVGLALIALGVTTGPILGLRALHATRQLLVLRSAQGVSHVLLGVGGAVLGGLVGAAFGLAFSQSLVAIAAWLLLRSVVLRS